MTGHERDRVRRPCRGRRVDGPVFPYPAYRSAPHYAHGHRGKLPGDCCGLHQLQTSQFGYQSFYRLLGGRGPARRRRRPPLQCSIRGV